jgi:hypothetical protein
MHPSNGVSRATDPGILRKSDFLGSHGLPKNIGVSSVILPFEELRSHLSAKIAVNAGCIIVISAGDILWGFFEGICHEYLSLLV